MPPSERAEQPGQAAGGQVGRGIGNASGRGDAGLYVTIGLAAIFRMFDEPPRTPCRVPPTP